MDAKERHHKHFLVIWTLLVKKKQFAIVLTLHRSIPLHSGVSYYLNRKAFLKSKEKCFFLTPISMKSSRVSFSQRKSETWSFLLMLSVMLCQLFFSYVYIYTAA